LVHALTESKIKNLASLPPFYVSFALRPSLLQSPWKSGKTELMDNFFTRRAETPRKGIAQTSRTESPPPACHEDNYL
jgi:hypothetical protein